MSGTDIKFGILIVTHQCDDQKELAQWLLKSFKDSAQSDTVPSRIILKEPVEKAALEAILKEEGLYINFMTQDRTQQVWQAHIGNTPFL